MSASVQTAPLKLALPAKGTVKQIAIVVIQDFTHRSTNMGSMKKNAKEINVNAEMELLIQAPTVKFTVKRTVDHVTLVLNLTLSRPDVALKKLMSARVQTVTLKNTQSV